MNKIKLIYFFIVVAVFNAVLRVSSESPLTLFRLLLPLCILLILFINKRVFNRLIIGVILFVAIAFLQNYIASTYLYPEVTTISLSHLSLYCVHYISMFVLAALVYCLWIIKRDDFFSDTVNFFSRLIKFILLLYIPYILMGNDPNDFLIFGNINDLGCILTGGILVILFDNVTKRKNKYIYISIILFLLLYNDSKLALFGAILEVVFFYIRYFSVKNVHHKKIVQRIMIAFAVLGIFFLFNTDLRINENSIHDLAYLPYAQITSGMYFDDSSQSLTFRSNTIIGITNILQDSKGIGIGPGNTSLVLKHFVPDPVNSIRQDYIASHIWWYEVFSDLGWFIIIPAVILYIKQWRSFFSKIHSKPQLFSQLFIIFFPIWCMSSSGLYTEFFTLSLLFISVILYRKRVCV